MEFKKRTDSHDERKKVFKSLDDQINILVNKGLIIDDINGTKDILFRENYFFISGYRQVFMTSNNIKRFIKGTTFDELYGMFLFDRNIRNIMFKNLLIIENNMKSVFSYILSKKYGHQEKKYLRTRNFSDDPMKIKKVSDVLSKIKRQIRINTKKHTATKHYIDNYGYIPFWILVKVLSFGIIGELYSILKEDDQYKVSSLYNLDVRTLEIYLSLLANYRNLCAHEDILYNYRTQRVIPNNYYHEALNIEKTDDEYIYGKNDMFSIIIIMKQLLTAEEFREMVREIGYEVDILNGAVSVVEIDDILRKIGLPFNFRDVVDIEKR